MRRVGRPYAILLCLPADAAEAALARQKTAGVVCAFCGPGFPGSVSPDGKRFLVIKEGGADGGQTNELVVVENWFEELKKLAPPKR